MLGVLDGHAMERRAPGIRVPEAIRVELRQVKTKASNYGGEGSAKQGQNPQAHPLST